MNIFCDVCRNINSHNQLTSEDLSVVLGVQEFQIDAGEKYYSSNWKNYALFRCDVCFKNTVLVVQECSTENDGSPYGDIEIFPKPRERLVPHWHKRLNNAVISDLMLQSNKAFNEGLYSLSLMGYRAIVDAWLNSHLNDCGGFELKLKKACEIQLISTERKTELGELVRAGHAVAHRGWFPDKETANKVMTCVEIILFETLSSVDIHSDIEHIKAVTPLRNSE